MSSSVIVYRTLDDRLQLQAINVRLPSSSIVRHTGVVHKAPILTLCPLKIMPQRIRRSNTSNAPHPRQFLPLLHMHLVVVLVKLIPLPLLPTARRRRTRPRRRLLIPPANLRQLPINHSALLAHLLDLLVQPFLQQLLPHSPARSLHRTRIVVVVVFPPLLARIRRPAATPARRAPVHPRHGIPTRRAPRQAHALLEVLRKARDQQAALAARTRVPGHILALLELLVDLGSLLLALFQGPVVVAAFVGRRRRRAVLRRVFARGRGVGVLAVAGAVFGGFALFLCRRTASDVGARERVVVDVVAGAAGPGLLLAVGGAWWGL